jgi:4-amino-4-deoxy-L-arabinose transferase-like glycosyltransferase
MGNPLGKHGPREGVAHDLAWLILLAAFYRVLFVVLSPRVLYFPDAVHYVETARYLAAGDFFAYNPKIPVFYPLLGVLAHFVITDWEWALRAVSMVLGTALAVPVYLLARAMHGRGAARLSASIVAIWPWLADFSAGVATEATAVFLWFSGVGLLVLGLRRHPAWLAGALGCFFALHLTRPEGTLILAAALPAGFVLCWPAEKQRLWRLVPFGLGAAVLLLLHTAYLGALTGAATVNYRAGFILEEFDFVRFGQTVLATSHEVLPIMLGPILLLFLGAGFFVVRERRDLRLELVVLLFCAVQWGVTQFVLSAEPRYLMAPIIALSTWSCAGIVFVQGRAAALTGPVRWLRFVPAAALVAAMLFNGAVTLGSEHLGRTPRQPREYKEAGQWMAANLEPGLIFTRKPQIAYYANMPSTGPALDETLHEAIIRAQAAGARYFAVDERYAPPALRALLDPAQAPETLRHLRSFDSWPGARVVIYEVRSP